jgi:hypothetical protein
MSKSNLERTGEQPPTTGKGHGTAALGPSDSSDTGSDITGGPGVTADDAALGLPPGSTPDLDRTRRRRKTAGPDIGDENLDSDSDSTGTGERGAAGRDAPPPADEHLGVISEAGANELVSGEDFEQGLRDQDREDDEQTARDPMRGRGIGAPEHSVSGSAPPSRRRPARPQFGVRRRSRR